MHFTYRLHTRTPALGNAKHSQTLRPARGTMSVSSCMYIIYYERNNKQKALTEPTAAKQNATLLDQRSRPSSSTLTELNTAFILDLIDFDADNDMMKHFMALQAGNQLSNVELSNCHIQNSGVWGLEF